MSEAEEEIEGKITVKPDVESEVEAQWIVHTPHLGGEAKDKHSFMGSVKFLTWLVLVLIVLSVGNFLRSFPVQESADKATAAANSIEITTVEARDASQDTLTELRAIVRRIEAGNPNEPDLQNQAIIDALQAIARLEAHICGGQCPSSGPG